MRNKPGKGGQVVSMAVVVAAGIAADGSREVLGLDVGDSEDETFWRALLLSLKQRGLGGVQLVISDQHSGLAHAPNSHAEVAVFGTIFAQPDPDAVSKAWDEVGDQLAGSFPKVGPLMDEAKVEVLAFNAFPKAHWRKIWAHEKSYPQILEFFARGGESGVGVSEPSY